MTAPPFNSLFRPSRWLSNGHLQTILPTMLPTLPLVETAPQTVETLDDDFLELLWTSPSADPDMPLLLILHGLEGSLRSHYVRLLLRQTQQLGWQGLLMYFRSCGKQHNRQLHTYHAGATWDLAFLLAWLRKRFPKRKIYASGYSLGGNVLLKYLGETGARSLIDRAVASSVPFDLGLSASRLRKGLSRIYQRYLLSQLRSKIQQKFADWPKNLPFDLEELAKQQDFRGFDNHITAPLHGFLNAEDYYTQCSCRQFLPYIQTPTLIIHAWDDPMIPPSAIPEMEELPDAVRFELARHGGHVGFINGGHPMKPTYWLQGRITEFLNS
ncbi:MAG: hydrolase [Candidatus Eutrophobiaceae bacterium]